VLTPIHPTPGAGFDPFSDEGGAELAARYAPPARDWLRINLIVSVSGSAAGSDGTSDTLTNRTDRRILGVVRSQADLVLVGAQSVRAEGYKVPRTALLGIVTMSGDLTGHQLIEERADRLMVFCPANATTTVTETLPGARVVAIAPSGGRLDVVDVLRAARDLGARSIVCEGGPSLAAQVASTGFVDEVCLTTASLLTGTTLPALGEQAFAPLPLELEGLLVDEASNLYSRWRVAKESMVKGVQP